MLNDEQVRRTMRGIKIANASAARELWTALARCRRLERRRAALPARVPVRNVLGDTVVKLAHERNHLAILIKMVAYQAESALLRLLAPHYSRNDDEGRTLIQSALAGGADIDVTDRELRLRLVPLSPPHRTRAIAALCDELNATPTCFPGTRLVLRYEVTGPREPQKADRSTRP